jgi:hypothetical protein
MRILLLVAALVACAQASIPTEVVHLVDDNFEHDTQASSGQTTGAVYRGQVGRGCSPLTGGGVLVRSMTSADGLFVLIFRYLGGALHG